MILVAAALAVLCAILILPALWLRGAADQQPIALLLLPAFGVALWVSAVAAGIGPQSLSNVIEVFIVVGVAIAAAYAKVLLLARFESTRRHAVVIVYGVVALTVWGLRQLMPVLAE